MEAWTFFAISPDTVFRSVRIAIPSFISQTDNKIFVIVARRDTQTRPRGIGKERAEATGETVQGG